MAADAGWLVWPQDAMCSVCGHVDLHWHKQAEERRKAKEKEEADKKEQARLKEQRHRQELVEWMDRRSRFRAAVAESIARQEKVTE